MIEKNSMSIKELFLKHWNSFMCYMRTKEFQEFLGAELRTQEQQQQQQPAWT